MTRFWVDTNCRDMTWTLVLETDDKKHFEHMQDEARKCVDHLPISDVFGSDSNWNDCRWSRGKLLHIGNWVDGRWYEWIDIFGNREVARMKLDSFDHFWPDTKIVKEQNVIAFREIQRNENEQALSKD